MFLARNIDSHVTKNIFELNKGYWITILGDAIVINELEGLLSKVFFFQQIHWHIYFYRFV